MAGKLVLLLAVSLLALAAADDDVLEYEMPGDKMEGIISSWGNNCKKFDVTKCFIVKDKCSYNGQVMVKLHPKCILLLSKLYVNDDSSVLRVIDVTPDCEFPISCKGWYTFSFKLKGYNGCSKYDDIVKALPKKAGKASLQCPTGYTCGDDSYNWCSGITVRWSINCRYENDYCYGTPSLCKTWQCKYGKCTGVNKKNGTDCGYTDYNLCKPKKCYDGECKQVDVTCPTSTTCTKYVCNKMTGKCEEVYQNGNPCNATTYIPPKCKNCLNSTCMNGYCKTTLDEDCKNVLSTY